MSFFKLFEWRNLDNILEDRSNNFELIRLVAALGVMYFHAGLIQNDLAIDAVYQYLVPDSTGSLSVYAFFLLSGVLISKSAESQRSIVVFALHRIFRIWPAIILYLLVAFLLLIPVGSSISIQDLLAIKPTRDCISDNLILVYVPCLALPGVFPQVHAATFFNASLWSLQVEIYCYVIVGVYSIISMYNLSSGLYAKLFYTSYIIVILALFMYFVHNLPADWHLQPPFVLKGGYSFYPAVYFFVGMLFYTYRKSIFFNLPVALILFVVSIFLIKYRILMYFSFPYAVIALAGSKKLSIIKPRQDYSYGVYIYSFTIQQGVANFLPSIGGPANFIISLVFTIVFAAVSWHLVEKPSLALARQMSIYARLLPFWLGGRLDIAKLSKPTIAQ